MTGVASVAAASGRRPHAGRRSGSCRAPGGRVPRGLRRARPLSGAPPTARPAVGPPCHHRPYGQDAPGPARQGRHGPGLGGPRARPGHGRRARGVLAVPLHPRLQGGVRRDSRPVPHAPPDRAGRGPAAHGEPVGDGDLPPGRLQQRRHLLGPLQGVDGADTHRVPVAARRPGSRPQPGLLRHALGRRLPLRPGSRVRLRPGSRVRLRPGSRVRLRPGSRVRLRPGSRVRLRPGSRVRLRPGSLPASAPSPPAPPPPGSAIPEKRADTPAAYRGRTRTDRPRRSRSTP
ncbi:hypothetical protein SUDANB108_03984 [Streptomyces sp. enrichment culture]